MLAVRVHDGTPLRVSTRVMQTRTNATADAQLTAAPIEPGASGSLPIEFCRIPDLERLLGVKRGMAYFLIKENKIKSVCLRKPGAKTGVRLVHLQSVRDYLNRFMQGSTASEDAAMIRELERSMDTAT